MRCLQLVLWRGALAFGLMLSAGTGALLMSQAKPPACMAVPSHSNLTVVSERRNGHAIRAESPRDFIRRQA